MTSSLQELPQIDLPDAGGGREDLDLEILRVVQAETGTTGAVAVAVAGDVQQRIRSVQIQRIATTIVADRTASREQRLETAHVVGAGAFLEEQSTPAPALLGNLVSEGHNATLTAQYKAGKTTLVANAAGALTTGGDFLGRFETGHPRRVAWLNYELNVDDQRELIRALRLPAEALERLLVINLRGTRLSLTTPAGRDWLVEQLADHRAEVLIADTYGAAVAPSIDSENDNAGARRFLATVDEIKALAGCASSIWTAHTGRKTHEDGAEHARGATVLDDWADVRLVLTKARDTGVRFLASEGRSSYDLPESALHYDPTTRGLWLPDTSVGTSRRMARAEADAEIVLRVVSETPGLPSTELRSSLVGLVTDSTKVAAAITKARTMDLIHTHREGHKVCHFAGGLHPEGEACTA